MDGFIFSSCLLQTECQVVVITRLSWLFFDSFSEIALGFIGLSALIINYAQLPVWAAQLGRYLKYFEAICLSLFIILFRYLNYS